MTRYVVDAGVVLHLAAETLDAPEAHELLAPTLLRPQTLSALHEAVHRRGRSRPTSPVTGWPASEGLRIRLLGDAVLRRRAWDVADRLGWASTYDAEYVALTRLQADAFATLDPDLARRASRAR